MSQVYECIEWWMWNSSPFIPFLYNLLACRTSIVAIPKRPKVESLKKYKLAHTHELAEYSFRKDSERSEEGKLSSPRRNLCHHSQTMNRHILRRILDMS